jgi:hypothetical protein
VTRLSAFVRFSEEPRRITSSSSGMSEACADILDVPRQAAWKIAMVARQYGDKLEQESEGRVS